MTGESLADTSFLDGLDTNIVIAIMRNHAFAISKLKATNVSDIKIPEIVREGVEFNLETLRSWCNNKISAYKIPRQLLTVDALPRNAMGKVTKPTVAKLFEQG